MEHGKGVAITPRMTPELIDQGQESLQFLSCKNGKKDINHKTKFCQIMGCPIWVPGNKTEINSNKLLGYLIILFESKRPIRLYGIELQELR